ncbi:MAG: FtsQ-type POTRA domain-containing protein [Gemmatimonadales bacterium]|nr:FtsQ-type POTRA domain-containing protein [Gemmatimonadales bacterium]
MTIIRRRAMLASLALILVLGGVVAVPRLMHRLDFFRIGAVEIVGARFLEEAEVVRRLGLPDDADILQPLAPLHGAAVAIPGVEAATVTRRWPATLRVELVETRPVAMTQQEDRFVLLDARGRILPFSPARLSTSLPIAEHDSLTAALLARMQRTDPVLYDQVQRAWREGGDVVIEKLRQRIRLRGDAGAAQMRNVVAVQAWLESTGTAWRELDARFRGRVFVRRGTV